MNFSYFLYHHRGFFQGFKSKRGPNHASSSRHIDFFKVTSIQIRKMAVIIPPGPRKKYGTRMVSYIVVAVQSREHITIVLDQ